MLLGDVNWNITGLSATVNSTTNKLFSCLKLSDYQIQSNNPKFTINT